TKMNGIWGQASAASFSADRPSKAGRVLSARMTSKRCASAAWKSARVSTRVTLTTKPSFSRAAWTSSASGTLSSRCRMRSGNVILRLRLRPSADAARRRLVDDGPEHAELLDRIHELMEVDRLDHVRVHAQPVARHHVAFLARRGKHDDRDHPQPVVGLDLLQDLQTVDLRQLQIEQEHGRVVGGAAGETPAAVQIVERLGAVARDDHFVGEV